ncbi:Endonuclease/exonuclease/phosphatase,Reverse transcriptase domain [Cinara cedri]|uniref:Endonuclease/exonuclease/phosphatase,Reverse transcriptase domain n=1 Tax=Cinara cedri TaxID=506608 RepID=A0A5E4M6Y1_9HEMI|nr:Endonuclease/exonuclease/phosphatase,Reverse transcriptase domain [Cinara cedri]
MSKQYMKKPKLKPRDRDLDKTQWKWPGLQGFRIGTWNVRTLYKAGALGTLVDAIDRYKVNIVALQEMRWQGEGCLPTGNMTLFFGGITSNKHENGVGFLVHNSLIPWIKQFRAINDRICYIRINMNHRDMVMICAYAPTESGNEETKDAFYEELEQVYDALPGHCIKLLLGDMNAQVGKENAYKATIGKHSLHDRSNDNGIRLINFAISKNMVISSTRFPRKNIHKETWLSPGGRYSSQIDHVLIENKFKTIIRNVKSYRGADADIDHYLILIDFRVKMSMEWKKKQKILGKYDVDKLKNEETLRTFQETVTNFLGKREGSDNEQVEESWKVIKASITESAEKVIQHTQRKKTKKWFNDNCKKGIKERNEARIKAIHTPTPENIRDFENKRREVTTLIRKEKRIAEKERLGEIENFKHNPREFFKHCKTFKNRFIPAIQMIEDNNGALITRSENMAEEFRMYFKKLLNRGSTTEEVGEQDDTINYTAEPEVLNPSLEETQYAIQTLKNNKSPGDDKIVAELLKLGGKNLTQKLHHLIQQIWIKEKIPQDWNESLICPIFKKGNRKKVENYRGITLLNTGYKVLSLIILKRLQIYTDEIVGNYQSGFRKNKSTTDHIFVIRQIMEKSYEFAKDLHMVFVDYKQAYDSIIREKLWKVLKDFGLPTKLINMIKLCNPNTSSRVKVNNEISSSFIINSGLKQGDAMSPVLFNMALESVIRKVPRTETLNLEEGNILLAYADDIVVIGNLREGIQNTVEELIKIGKDIGLTINSGKTKYMMVKRGGGDHNNLHVGNNTFEEVQEFKYLGSTLNNQNNMHGEINIRLGAANRCLYALKTLFKSKLLSRKTKEHLYISYIHPILTYACAT